MGGSPLGRCRWSRWPRWYGPIPGWGGFRRRWARPDLSDRRTRRSCWSRRRRRLAPASMDPQSRFLRGSWTASVALATSVASALCPSRALLAASNSEQRVPSRPVKSITLSLLPTLAVATGTASTSSAQAWAAAVAPPPASGPAGLTAALLGTPSRTTRSARRSIRSAIRSRTRSRATVPPRRAG